MGKKHYPETCSVCGSAQIAPDIRIADRSDSMDGDLQVVVAKKPNALIFQQRVKASLRAWICGECGHVDLFVENPQELYEAYLASLIGSGESGGGA